MKFAFGLFLILCVSSVSALDLRNREDISSRFENADKTYFEIIGEYLEKGTVPDIKILLDVAWIGRCFHISYPDSEIGAGYIFRKGPLSKDNTIYEAANWQTPRLSPHSMDDWSYKQILKITGRSWFVSATINQNSITSTWENVSYTLKYFDPYLVEDVKNAESKNTYMRCYFYIQKK